jgi:hypothetical protein
MSTTSNLNPATTSAHVEQVIRSAELELDQLLRQRAETMKRIGTIKQTLVGLAKVFGDAVLTPELALLLGRSTARKQPGFTRACRVVLMESSVPLDARHGYYELRRRFPDLASRHKDPLASLTTVFNRLAGYGEVRSFRNQKGRRMWEWIADSGNSQVTPLLSSLQSSQNQAGAIATQ